MNERALSPGSAHRGQLHQGSHKEKVTCTHPQGTQIIWTRHNAMPPKSSSDYCPWWAGLVHLWGPQAQQLR